MTANLDYTYIELTQQSLKVNVDKMIRAVRIKLGVKEKIINNYNPIQTEKKEEPVMQENLANKESLIDTSEENLQILNQKLDNIINQHKLPCNVKRAVLFTKGFVEKINSVNASWFPINEVEKVEQSANTMINDMPIPSGWENILENPSIEQDTVEVPEAPDAEIENTDLPNENVEIPTPETPNENVADMQRSTSETSGENVNNMPMPEISSDQLNATIPEPKVIENEINPFNFDLSNVSSAENKNDNIVSETPLNEIANPENSTVSVEDKIAELLNRSRIIPEEPKLEDKKDPSQADVIAKVQKAKNALKDKEAEISSLKIKIEEINGKYNSTKAKLEGYNAVIRDVTSKYDDAMKENGELKSKNAQLEESADSKIVVLEEQIKVMQKEKELEKEKSQQIISELKSQHSKEIEEINRNNNLKIQSIKEEKDRQLKEAYNSILNVLSPSEETIKKVA